MCRKFLIITLAAFVSNALWAQAMNSVEIFFEINEFEINEHNKQILEKITGQTEINEIKILGYGDFLGSQDYNLKLSQKRANAVKEFFISKKMNPEVISACKGEGIHPESSFENRKDQNDPGIGAHRKVKIIFYYKQEEKNAENTITDVITEKQPKEEQVVIPIFREISIDSIEVGEHLILDNIIFYGGTHRIHRNSYSALHSLLGFMRANPTVSISIEGHICCEYGGRDGYDMDAGNHFLSENRARVVYDFLVNNGIDENRLQYKGHGSKYKLYPDEKTTYEQDMNRRVELVILDK